MAAQRPLNAVLWLAACLCLPCKAQEMHASRLVLLNRCSEAINLYRLDPSKNERVLEEEAIPSGGGVAIFSPPYQKFEVERVTDDSATTFQIGEIYRGQAVSSMVTIDEELEVHIEDFISRNKTAQSTSKQDFDKIYPHRLNLNSDFSIFPKMDSLWRPYQLDHRRFSWQHQIYRNTPIAAFLDNKLLMHVLLDREGIPVADILYGAFKSKSMGGWPQYTRESFIQAMECIPKVAEDHHFILKSISMQGINDVVLMNDELWEWDEWDIESLAIEAVEPHLEAVSNGLLFDHRGVIVQESVLHPYDEVAWYYKSFDDFFLTDRIPVFQLKVHVVFGKLCGGRIRAVPYTPDGFIDLSFCDGNGPSFYFASGISGASRKIWDKLEPLIEEETELIEAIAVKIYNLFGLDHFAIDIFMDGDGLFIVNDVTYPSFYHADHDCTNQRLFDAYRMGSFDLLNGTAVLESLLEKVDVSYEDFMDATDYHNVMRYSEAELEIHDYFWHECEEGDHSPKFYDTGVYYDSHDKDVCVARA